MSYLYQYADGTTGYDPFQRDASGNLVYGADGRLSEGGVVYGKPGSGVPDSISILGDVVNFGGGAGGNSAAAPAPGGPSFGGGGFGGGSSGGSLGLGASGGANSSLQTLAETMASTMTNNFNRNQLPRLQSQVAAAGGYGGSRQGVVEANAVNDLNAQIGNALAGLYHNGYNTNLNYDLGLRGNALGYANLDRNINNDNYANQMQGVNLGLNIWDRLQGNNQAAIGAGNTIQNTPMDYWNQFSQGANSIGQGYGTQTQSGQRGNPMLGALGGAQLGGQLANWWGGGSSSNSWAGMPNQNVYMGTGSMGD